MSIIISSIFISVYYYYADDDDECEEKASKNYNARFIRDTNDANK